MYFVRLRLLRSEVKVVLCCSVSERCTKVKLMGTRMYSLSCNRQQYDTDTKYTGLVLSDSYNPDTHGT